MTTIALASTTVSGFLEADFNQIKDALQDGGVEPDFFSLPLKTSAPTAVNDGQVYYDTVTDKVFVRLNGAWVEVGTISTSQTFTNKTIDADQNTLSNIENADIKAAAAIALNKLAATTASRALVSDGSGFVSAATTTATEIGYVNGVTSAIQTQINAKLGIAPRVNTITSNATPTHNTDNYDALTITALATNITSMTTNLSGTPSNFQKWRVRIKDDGTPRTITWGASFASRGATLPTTTTANKVTNVGLEWNSVTSTWDCIATNTEA